MIIKTTFPNLDTVVLSSVFTSWIINDFEKRYKSPCILGDPGEDSLSQEEVKTGKSTRTNERAPW